jgi:hypothetical protein
MKKLIALITLTAAVALASELPIAKITGTNTQSLVVGRGRYISVQCTTSVRYETASSTLTPTLSTSDPIIAVGDPYRIKLAKGHDRIFISHQDLTTAIDCNIFAVEE